MDPSAENATDYKYALVVDGDSGDDGGDFVRSVKSGHVTLRASIYRRWYDHRLVPWLHFIPMDNTFIDLYGIMEYFLGTHVSEEDKDFAHAVGEVQKHEHHFNTPGEEAKADMIADLPTGLTIAAEANHLHYESPATGSPTLGIVDSSSDNEPHDCEDAQPTLGKRNEDDHEAAAGRIADASKEWAEKILRREDMLIYVYRLLLEYARIVDDRRERLGWVGDLIDV